MLINTEVTRVTVRWDNQHDVAPTWYCQTFVAGSPGPIDDSQKIWFPVDCDAYARDKEDELLEALLEAFPNAEIKVERR